MRLSMESAKSTLGVWFGMAWLFLSLLLLATAPAQAASSPEIQKGLTWLQSQIQADGSLAGESASIATSLQGRTETLVSLKLLATIPTPLVGAIAANTEDNTEYLARQAISLNLAGQNADTGISALLARQNTDGGFGGAPGLESNPLDTAWALLAFKTTNIAAPVPGALSYLQSAQDLDGSFHATDRSDIYTSALALQALAAYSSQYTLSTNIQATVGYLQSQQVAGSWTDSPFLSAEAYLALHDLIPQSPTASALVTFLATKQLADGSWGGDPYATALVLRALTLAGSAPANPSLSILRGKVVDAQTGLPLSGAAAALTGGASLNLLTQADGVFEFRDLPPGDYALQLTLANYGTISATTATRAGQTQDMGVLRMSKAAGATTGTAEGKVTDAATGQALGGATVSVNGTLNATTDASGLYQISNVPTGAVTLEASMAGYASASSAGSLSAGGLMVFSPALTSSNVPTTTATLQGTVTSATTGLPLAGVTITLSGANALSATTDAQGKFSLSGLATGAITVSATLNGYDTVSAGANVYVRNTITFSPKMYPSGTTPSGGNTNGVTGVVMDAGSNAPLAGVGIVAIYSSTTKTLQSGADGRFSLAGISTASVDLKFTLAGYQASTVTVALEPLVVLDIGQIRLRKDKATALLPDLTVKTASRQGAVTDQQTLLVSGSVSATLANIGSVAAPAGVQVLAFQDVNRNGAYDPGVDAVLGQLTLPTEIVAGAETQVQIPVQGMLPFRDAPIHIWVDSAQSVVELKENNNVGSTAMGVEIKPNIGTFKPVVKWEWKDGTSIATPIVGPLIDTNGDGKIDQNDIPAVIVVKALGIDGGSGILTALSGKDGHQLWAIGHAPWNPQDQALYSGSETTPVLADIDGDGKPEVVMWLQSGSIAAINNDGSLKWKVYVPPTGISGIYNYGALSVADLDGDGKAEIIARNNVFNSDGSLRFKFNETVGHLAIPLVADLDGDGKPEIVLGPSAYHADGTLYWRNSLPLEPNLMLMGVADFDGNGSPEIVLVSGGWSPGVYMLNHDGSVKWGPVRVSPYNGGAPTIGDVDGDGIPEIGIAGPDYYTLLNADGSVKWKYKIQDASGGTGSTMFDFDGDGTAEIVYFDEWMLRVFNGATGNVVFSMPNISATASEYPVVADVDGDGHADIVVPQNYGPAGMSGIRVFQDQNNSWVNTRKIWNQYNYHITNINDNGSVPRVEQNSWQVHNTYRLNARPGVSSTTVPDLTASYIRVQDRGGVQPSTFTVRIGNGGGLAVDSGAFVAFYNGKPEAGGVLLGTVKTSLGLGSGEYQDLDLSYPGALTGIAELVIVADDDGNGKNAITDFDRANNRASLLLSALPGSFAIQIATDQSGYGPNSPVAISASVTNAGSFDGNANVRFSVETADGSIQVATLPATTLAVAKTASGTVAATWNTGTTYLGAYRVKAELLDGQGASFAEATSPFGIGTSATLAVAARITSDKQSYLPTDTVNLADRVSNLTQNQMLDNLTAVTTVYAPDGSVLWSQSATLAQLVPAAFKDLSYGVNLAMAIAGSYRAVLSVKDAAGAELTRAETAFTVKSTGDTGSGLAGSVSVAAKQVYQGDQLLISSTVTNLGNAAVTALPLTLSIVDPASQAVLASWPVTANIAKGGSYQGVQTWSSGAGMVNTAYMAVLTATAGGKTLTLGYDTFTVTEPPVKLDVKQQLLREGRLLVLLSCKNGEGDDHRNARSSSLKPKSSNSRKHWECDNDDDKICIDERAGFLDDALTSLGITHWVSATLADFKQAFRSGKYNVYWLSGGALKLDNDLAQEIREAVNRGDGLLLEGIHDERNGLLDEVAGVRYRGKLSTSNQPITLSGPLFTSGTIAPTRGRPLKLTLNGGTQQAKFPTGIRCDDCDDDRDRRGTSPGDSPAIVSNAYGKGRGMVMAFDLMGILTQAPPVTPVWQEIMQATFGYLAPQTPDPREPEFLTAGAYAVARTTLTNQGQAVALEVTDLLPPGAVVLSTNPQTTANPDNTQAKWSLNLVVGQVADLTLALRVPETSGSYTLTTSVNSIRNGQSKLYGSYPLALNVASAMELAVTNKLIADLKALVFTASRDREARDQAVKALQDAITKTGQGKNDDAIEKLLDAVDKLRRIGGKDMSAYRLAVDRWLQELELEWLNAALTVKH